MQIKHIAAVAIAFTSFVPVAVFAQAPAGAQHGNRVNGVVQSITNGTVTVTSRRNPTPVMFTVDANTKVSTSAPTTAAALVANTPVRVEGTISADGKSMDANRITILTALPTKGAKHWGLVKPDGKRIEGTVTSASPLTVTSGDGTVVAVSISLTTQFTQLTPADQTAIVAGAHVQANLDAANTAREVTILPARHHRRTAAAI